MYMHIDPQNYVSYNYRGAYEIISLLHLPYTDEAITKYPSVLIYQAKKFLASWLTIF